MYLLHKLYSSGSSFLSFSNQHPAYRGGTFLMLTWGRCKICPFHFTSEECAVSQRTNGCHACDQKDCWHMNSACEFFGRSRELHPDAEWGDTVPHFRETRITCTADGLEIEGRHSLDWWKQYRDVCFSVDNVNHFDMGKASGDECNCLIDTLRQQMKLDCDIRAVRNYVQARHPTMAATEFLELQRHWVDVISGLAHVLGRKFVPSAYKIICVDAMFIGNGDVEGNGSRTLYIARQNADHFVPLLRRTANNGATANNKRPFADAMLHDNEKEVWLPVLQTGDNSALCQSWLEEVSPLLSKYDATLLHRYIPNLPTSSLQKVWNASRSDYFNYLARDVWQNEQHGEVEQISKMAMRRILETSFQRLALNDPAIEAVYKQWVATSEKPKRKSIASAKRHTADWHWRRQQQSVRKW